MHIYIYRRLEKVSKVNPTGKSDSVRLRLRCGCEMRIAMRCEMRNAMRSCVSGCEGECSPSEFPGAGIFSMQCPPPCRAAARGSPFCAAGRCKHSPQNFFIFLRFWMKCWLICAAGRCEFSPLNAFGGDYLGRPAAFGGDYLGRPAAGWGFTAERGEYSRLMILKWFLKISRRFQDDSWRIICIFTAVL